MCGSSGCPSGVHMNGSLRAEARMKRKMLMGSQMEQDGQKGSSIGSGQVQSRPVHDLLMKVNNPGQAKRRRRGWTLNSKGEEETETAVEGES
jgi:hypothetical protein